MNVRLCRRNEPFSVRLLRTALAVFYQFVSGGPHNRGCGRALHRLLSPLLGCDVPSLGLHSPHAGVAASPTKAAFYPPCWHLTPPRGHVYLACVALHPHWLASYAADNFSRSCPPLCEGRRPPFEGAHVVGLCRCGAGRVGGVKWSTCGQRATSVPPPPRLFAAGVSDPRTSAGSPNKGLGRWQARGSLGPHAAAAPHARRAGGPSSHKVIRCGGGRDVCPQAVRHNTAWHPPLPPPGHARV